MSVRENALMQHLSRVVYERPFEVRFQGFVDGVHICQQWLDAALVQVVVSATTHATAHQCGAIGDGGRHLEVSVLLLRAEAMLLLRRATVIVRLVCEVSVIGFIAHFAACLHAVIDADHQVIGRAPEVMVLPSWVANAIFIDHLLLNAWFHL